MKWVRNNNTYKEENTLFALEHTGIYSEQIAQVNKKRIYKARKRR